MTGIEALIERYKAQATGYLVLKEDQSQRSCIFKKGQVTYVESNSREETLGELLVLEGRITKEQQLESVNRMLETGKMLGDVLIEMGVLAPNEVFDYLNRQIAYKLKRTLLMRSCTVIFSEKMPENLPSFSIPFVRTVLDGLMEFYTPPRYKAEGGFKRDSTITLTPLGKDNLTRIKPSTDEAKSIRLVQKKLRSAAFISQSPNKRFAAALLFLGEKLGYFELKENEKKKPALDQLYNQAVSAIDYDSSLGSDKPLQSPLSRATTPGQSAQDPMYALWLKTQRMDHFDLLQCPRTTSHAEAERGYNTLIKKYHLADIDGHYPEEDRRNAQQLLDRITLAYSIVGDEKKRLKYTDDLDKGEAQHTASEDMDPKLVAEAEIIKAEMYLKHNQFEQARSAANQAIEHWAKESEFYVLLAEAQMKLDIKNDGKPSKQVEEHLRKAIDNNEQYFRSYLVMALYFKQLGDSEKATNFFRRTLEANPKCRKAEAELRLIEMRDDKKRPPLFSSFRKKA